MEEETASRREDFAITAVSGSRKIVAVRCVSDPCERTRVRVCACVFSATGGLAKNAVFAEHVCPFTGQCLYGCFSLVC